MCRKKNNDMTNYDLNLIKEITYYDYQVEHDAKILITHWHTNPALLLRRFPGRLTSASGKSG